MKLDSLRGDEGHSLVDVFSGVSVSGLEDLGELFIQLLHEDKDTPADPVRLIWGLQARAKGQSKAKVLMVRVIDDFQVSTSGGQTCGQEAAVHQTCHLERESFYLVRP